MEGDKIETKIEVVEVGVTEVVIEKKVKSKNHLETIDTEMQYQPLGRRVVVEVKIKESLSVKMEREDHLVEASINDDFEMLIFNNECSLILIRVDVSFLQGILQTILEL